MVDSIDALSFEHVSKRYRNAPQLALDDVSFSIPVGARTCLLGPNGAGKSTSIRLLQGALQPTVGQVRLLDSLVGTDDYLSARRRTGIVPQGPGMYADLTVAEYLSLAHDLYGRGDSANVVAAFSLGDQLEKRLAQLSGGFQRRVVLAVALLAEPDVLLLDEPTVGLDPLAAHDVHEFLRQAMHQTGRTTLLCTHNMAEAEALCEDVIILRDGRILVDAPLKDLRRRVRPRLRLRARQGDEALLAALGDTAAAADAEGGVTVDVADPQLEAPPLLRRLLGQGLDIYACEPLQPGLEALFLDLVRSP
ncbi:MAG TPA: ABC transporter ATP-binding protein [Chloroflexota bacterium]|nr:ABC transporter ATP-binding protein [Chloroflexota bacterium]